MDEPERAGGILIGKKPRTYTFDAVFAERDDNHKLFTRTLPPLVEGLLEGVNGTCFAYGMTGSGKTHTMLGDSAGEQGICVLAAEMLFDRVGGDSTHKHDVRASYLEIYNEQVRDLLSESPGEEPLMIVEDPLRGVVVPALTEYSIDSAGTLMQLILRGNRRRTMAETSVNQFSSRSHAILQISLESKSHTDSTYTTAKLSLIDLAGSERAAGSSNSGLRQFEGAKINRSLLALGNCINILSDRAKVGAFVPYRDSKLTRLLKDSLGGNTRTVMVACISPTALCCEETINTLKYAERAKKIKKKVVKNVREAEENVTRYKGIIEGLKGEIASLRIQLRSQRPESSKSVPAGQGAIADIELQIQKAQQCRKGLEFGEEAPTKVSDYLLTKYEEHCEMVQSLGELESMERTNQELAAGLQRSMEELKTKIAACNDPEMRKQLSSEQQRKTASLAELRSNVESNKETKKSIETSLRENVQSQERLRGVFAGLDPAQQRAVIELQISIRTLRLQNMDLVLQNLEMKRLACISDLERKENTRKIEEMRAQLESMRELLRRKDEQLHASRSQPRLRPAGIRQDGNKTRNSDYSTPANRSLACGPSYLQMSRRNQHRNNPVQNNNKSQKPAVPSCGPIIVNIKNIRVSKETPRRSFIEAHGSHNRRNVAAAASRTEAKREDPDTKLEARPRLASTKFCCRRPEAESFASLSSVTVNYDGLPSEADFLDSCADCLPKPVAKAGPADPPARKAVINEGYYDVLRGLTENKRSPEVKTRTGNLPQQKRQEPIIVRAVIKTVTKQPHQKGRRKCKSRAGTERICGVRPTLGGEKSTLTARKSLVPEIQRPAPSSGKATITNKTRSISLQAWTKIGRLRDERKMAKSRAEDSLAPIQAKLNGLFSSVSENGTDPGRTPTAGLRASVPQLISPSLLPYPAFLQRHRLKLINISQLSNLGTEAARSVRVPKPRLESPFRSIRLRQRAEMGQGYSSVAAESANTRLNREISELIRQQKAKLRPDFEAAEICRSQEFVRSSPPSHKNPKAAVCSGGDTDGAEDDVVCPDEGSLISENIEEMPVSIVHPSSVRAGIRRFNTLSSKKAPANLQ